MKKRLAYALLPLLLVTVSCDEQPSARPAFARSTLSVTLAGNGAVFPFAVEVATSEAEQAYGLMFVKSLDPDAGMIFPYNPPRAVSFWMKNTLIPLDMLFVGPDHSIGHIVTNAKPGDVTPIPSDGPVIAVIEIPGGQVNKDGIKVGDKVDGPLMSQSAQ